MKLLGSKLMYFLRNPKELMTDKKMDRAERYGRSIMMSILGIIICLGALIGIDYLIQTYGPAGYMGGSVTNVFRAIASGIETLLNSELCRYPFGTFSSIPAQLSGGKIDALTASGYASFMGTVLMFGWASILMFFIVTLGYNIAELILSKSGPVQKETNTAERIYTVVFYVMLGIAYVMVFSCYPLLLCCGAGSVMFWLDALTQGIGDVALVNVIGIMNVIRFALLAVAVIFCIMQIINFVKMHKETRGNKIARRYRNNISTMSPMFRRCIRPFGIQALIFLIINIVAILIVIVVIIIMLLFGLALVGTKRDDDDYYY